MSSAPRNILVVGASGLLGGLVAKALARRDGQTVRILTRDATRSKLNDLVSDGLEAVTGDLKDPRSLARACTGVDAVVSTATSVLSEQPGDGIDSVDREGQLNLVQAAESAGVRRFVFISFPAQSDDFPLQSAKRAVEERLSQSTLNYTILRPTYFQDVWLTPALGFDYASGRVRLFGDGTRPMRWISAMDVADAVVRCLLLGVAPKQTVELLGPEALGGLDVVRIFEQVARRKFTVELVPEEFLAAQQAAASDPRQQSFFALARQNARGYSSPRPVPADMPFNPATTVRQYAERLILQESPSR